MNNAHAGLPASAASSRNLSTRRVASSTVHADDVDFLAGRLVAGLRMNRHAASAPRKTAACVLAGWRWSRCRQYRRGGPSCAGGPLRFRRMRPSWRRKMTGCLKPFTRRAVRQKVLRRDRFRGLPHQRRDRVASGKRFDDGSVGFRARVDVEFRHAARRPVFRFAREACGPLYRRRAVRLLLRVASAFRGNSFRARRCVFSAARPIRSAARGARLRVAQAPRGPGA